MRYNWPDVIGLPTPDAQPWMLRDVPISRSTFESLKRDETGISKVDAQASVGSYTGEVSAESITQPRTMQCRFETDYEPGKQPNSSVLELLVDTAPVTYEQVEAFAADTTADLYVVEAAPGDVVSCDIQDLREQYDIDVQLIGVGKSCPDGYPGEFVQVDEYDVSDPVFRAMPDPDVFVCGAVYASHTAVDLGDECEVLVCPSRGEFGETVEIEFIRDAYVDAEVGDDDDEQAHRSDMRLDAFGEQASDPGDLHERQTTLSVSG